MNNKKLKFCIIFLLVVIFIAVIIFIKKNDTQQLADNKINEQANDVENIVSIVAEENENIQDKTVVEDLKKQTGLEADNDLYKIDTEYDGREVLNIRDNVQFNVAFAGLIKQNKPNMNEVETIVKKNYPKRKGIWIEKNSRKRVFELIENNTKSEYKIDEEGYLMVGKINQQNKNDIRLQQIINGNDTIILSVSAFYYEVDTVTGEIVEYPYEKLDSYQAIEKIDNEDNKIIFITTNSKKKLTTLEILEEILNI